MQISINKDFEKEYPQDAFKGLTWMQTLCFAIGMIGSVGMMFLFWIYTNLPVDIVVYISLPFLAVCMGIGFYKYQNRMTVYQWIKQMIRFEDTKLFVYQAYEMTPGKERVYQMEREDISHINKKKRRGRKV